MFKNVTFELNLKGEIDMATVNELTSLAQQIVAGLNNIATKIQELKDQIAAGGTITEADLDPVAQVLQEVIDQQNTILA